MPDKQKASLTTLALSTKLEEDFVAPLASLRGALEIVRDFPDLPADERGRFLETALKGCLHLERSIVDLSESVYAAGRRSEAVSAPPPQAATGDFATRIHVLEGQRVIALDCSDFVFSDSKVVNAFYDAVEAVVERSGHDWYFIVDIENCRVWPEAWVAHAHRGKRLDEAHSLGTFRYATGGSELPSERAIVLASREAALARVEALREGEDMSVQLQG